MPGRVGVKLSINLRFADLLTDNNKFVFWPEYNDWLTTIYISPDLPHTQPDSAEDRNNLQGLNNGPGGCLVTGDSLEGPGLYLCHPTLSILVCYFVTYLSTYFPTSWYAMATDENYRSNLNVEYIYIIWHDLIIYIKYTCIIVLCTDFCVSGIIGPCHYSEEWGVRPTGLSNIFFKSLKPSYKTCFQAVQCLCMKGRWGIYIWLLVQPWHDSLAKCRLSD